MIAATLSQPEGPIESGGPDARVGVFETILIFEDRPIELGRTSPDWRPACGCFMDRSHRVTFESRCSRMRAEAGWDVCG